MREVDVRTFAQAHAQGADVVDVRERFEYAAGHVPQTLHIPLGELSWRMSELPRSRPVYVICATGVRSFAAAQAMARSGIDARSVAGGISAWARAGHPVSTASHAA